MGDNFLHNWTDEEEEQILREIGRDNQIRLQYQAQVTEQEGLDLEELMLVAPDVDPQLLSDLARATSSGLMDIDMAGQLVLDYQEQELAIQAQEQQQELESDEPKNWWEKGLDWGYDKLKTGSRYGFAAMQLVPDVIGHTAARVYATSQPDDPRASMSYYKEPQVPWYDIGAAWNSTDLGALFSGEDAGEGFFVGEDARQFVEENAIRYRGGFLEEVRVPQKTVWDPDTNSFVTVENYKVGDRLVGWSPGRSWGAQFSAPGTEAYHNISGVVDAVFQLAAPTGVKAAKPVVVTGQRAVADLTAGTRASYRSLAGARNLGSPFINPQRARTWLYGSREARDFVEYVRKVDNVEDARRLLPKADNRLWNRVVQAEETPDVLRVLEEEMGIAPGLRNVSEVNWSRWSDVKTRVMRNPVSRAISWERAAARRPGDVLKVGLANDIEKTRTVGNVADWLIAAKIPFEKRRILVNRLSNALAGETSDVRASLTQVRDVLTEGLIERGLPGNLAENIVKGFNDNFANINRFGDVTTDGAADLHALLNKILIAGQDENGNWMRVKVTEDLKTAFLDSEHLRHEILLPSADEIIRATSPYKWLFESGSLSRSARRRIQKMRGRSPEEILDLEKKLDGYFSGGRQRIPIAGVDIIQNLIFKKLVLGSLAYINRAVLEGSVRQAFSPGLKGGVMHPAELIVASSMNPKFGKYLGTLEGDEWAGVTYRMFDDAYAEYIDAVSPVIAGEVAPNKLAKMTWQASTWRSYVRGDPEYRRAFGDSLYQLATDRLTRAYARNGVDDIVTRALDGDREIISALEDVQYRLAGQPYVPVDAAGNVIGDVAPYSPTFFTPSGKVIPEMVRQHVESYVASRYRKFTRGVPEFEEIIRNGDAGGRFLDPQTGMEAYAFVPLDGSVKLAPRSIGEYGEEFRRIVDALPDDFFPPVMKGRVTVPVRVKGPESADPRINKLTSAYDAVVDYFFHDLVGRPESFLNRSPVFRRFYHQSIDALLDELKPGEAKIVLENMSMSWRRAANIERELLERAQKVGKRWKVGNKEITDNAYQRRLEKNQREIAKHMKQRPTAARPYAFPTGWGRRYVGSKELFDDLVGKAAGKLPETGTRTLEEVSSLSKMFALNETKRLLYDVSEASNFAESFQILSPFFKAYKEGLTKWPKMIMTNPGATRKLQRTYQGLEAGDPDNDGRGFIYDDPISGEKVFGLPLGKYAKYLPLIASGGFVGYGVAAGLGKAPLPGFLGGAGGTAALTTGGLPPFNVLEDVDVDINYNVGSINMGLQSIGPGVGPVIQVAVSRLAPSIPMGREIEEILVPFGPPDTTLAVIPDVRPAWMKKAFDVLEQAIGGDGGRYFYELVTESQIALYASHGPNSADPKYDTRDEQSMVQLEKDAIAMARTLGVIHAASQFTGPARPDTDLRVPTEFSGDITIDEVTTFFDNYVPLRYLSREWRLMQDEDYENAVMNFIQTFGSDVFLVMAGKTQTTVGGLSASAEFYEWERQNPDIVNDVPDLYGYFAGAVGSSYDDYAYRKQIQSGGRLRFDDPQVQLESAQVILARGIYTKVLRDIGPNPDPAQLAMVRAVREELSDRYPLWFRSEQNLNEVPKQIDTIENAVFEFDSLRDNPAAKTARAYFDARTRAIDIAQQRRAEQGNPPVYTDPLGGQQMADLRGDLRLVGFILSYSEPDFERLWSDVLLREVDVRAEDR